MAGEAVIADEVLANDYLITRKAAEFLGFRYNTFYKMVRRTGFPHVCHDGAMFFKKSDVEKLAEEAGRYKDRLNSEKAAEYLGITIQMLGIYVRRGSVYCRNDGPLGQRMFYTKDLDELKKKIAEKKKKDTPEEKSKKRKKYREKCIEKRRKTDPEFNAKLRKKEREEKKLKSLQEKLGLATNTKDALLHEMEQLLNAKAKIVALKDFGYFLDNFVYIEDKKTNAAIKLNLWPSQREILPTLINSELLEILKTRQVGLTWLCAAMVLWLAIKHPLHLSVIISASEDHAKEFLDRVYFILDRLPEWFVPPIASRTVLSLEFVRDNLKSTIKSMPTIEIGAESKTPNLLVLDEAHTVRNVGTIFSSSYPGIEQAKGRVIVIANSVKNGPGWPWVRDNYIKSMRGEGRFQRIFLPWNAHPERPENFRQLMIDSGMNMDEVMEHYPESEQEAIQSAFGSFFGKSLEKHDTYKNGDCGYLLRGESGILTFCPDRRGILEIWQHPESEWKDRYAIGSDVGEGLGQDYSVAYVKDRIEDRIVARLRSNRIDAHAWGDYLNDLSAYYGGALVCCERTGSGITTIKRMEELGTPQYVRISAGKTGGVIQKEFGWSTTQSSKYELCGDLKAWFASAEESVPCGLLVDEASTFIRMETGRLGGEEGKHDDCVIAAALSIQADRFLGAAKRGIEEEKSSITLEFIAKMDREEAIKEASCDSEFDYEW